MNGIASEYVRRLDDDPSKHLYKDSPRSSVSGHVNSSTDGTVGLIFRKFFFVTLSQLFSFQETTKLKKKPSKREVVEKRAYMANRMRKFTGMLRT